MCLGTATRAALGQFVGARSKRQARLKLENFERDVPGLGKNNSLRFGFDQIPRIGKAPSAMARGKTPPTCQPDSPRSRIPACHQFPVSVKVSPCSIASSGAVVKDHFVGPDDVGTELLLTMAPPPVLSISLPRPPALGGRRNATTGFGCVVAASQFVQAVVRSLFRCRFRAALFSCSR